MSVRKGGVASSLAHSRPDACPPLPAGKVTYPASFRIGSRAARTAAGCVRGKSRVMNVSRRSQSTTARRSPPLLQVGHLEQHTWAQRETIATFCRGGYAGDAGCGTYRTRFSSKSLASSSDPLPAWHRRTSARRRSKMRGCWCPAIPVLCILVILFSLHPTRWGLVL